MYSNLTHNKLCLVYEGASYTKHSTFYGLSCSPDCNITIYKCFVHIVTESKVVDKRDNSETGVTRRRRECLTCKKRYTTYERIENINLMVEKRSGRLQEFDRSKLKLAIKKAVKKRPITDQQIDEIIDDIELRLLNRKTTQVKSTDIGKMVLTRLKKLDSVGYLLFASVYKDFNSINDFQIEINNLEDEG